jgi:hypothetical protein
MDPIADLIFFIGLVESDKSVDERRELFHDARQFTC